MIECIKRQKIVKRAESLTLFRCMNKQCAIHGQEVGEDICSRCPNPVIRHTRPCKKQPQIVNPRSEVPENQINKEEMDQLLFEMGAGDEEIEKIKDRQKYPSISTQLWSYKEALIKWVKAGRPERTQEEVDHLLATHCAPCDWYDKKKKRCKGCGCKVTTSSFAVANKLKMKTEHCPQGLF